MFSEWYIIRNQATGVDEQRNVRSSYTYRTDGVKLRKKYITYFSKGAAERTTTTGYLDGFQYTINHVGAVSLEFIPTGEGYFNFENNKYIYNYVDHLGNVRLSYFNNGNGIEVLQENNYYPFGLKHEGYNALDGNTFYQYKYQGQELQTETGWYNFKWRNYMPDLGRFFNVDPLSEKYSYQSHYNFSENRVVDGRELEGLEFIPMELFPLFENTGVTPIGPVMEPLVETRPPFLDPTPIEPTYGPYLIDEVEVTGSGPLELEPAGLDLSESTPTMDKITESIKPENITEEIKPENNDFVKPENWETRETKSPGKQHIDPNNPRNNVREMNGNKNSPHPSQQKDYIKYQKDGVLYDKNGQPTGGGRTPEAHIPKTEFDQSKMPGFE